MEKELVSFSDCGQYFVHYASDGKLKIWDTFSGSLKQDFAPNLHLKSPCTCLTWMSLSSLSPSPNPKRKRKITKTKGTKVIALGTYDGSLALYSLAEGNIVSTLRDEHSSTIKGVSWSREAGIFSVDGSHVTHWNLEFNSVESKWKCKGNTTRIAVSPNGDMCVTGSFNISLWDVETRKCLRTFIGHSSEMCNLIFINDNYFLSCGSNDRHISAWTTNGEEEAAIARFSLGENVKGEISLQIVNKTTLIMAATTFSGSLLYYSQQLNGKVSKVIKPVQRIELVSNTQDEINSQTAIPIVCSQLRTSDSVLVVYGYSPLFGFETFSVSLEREKQIVSVTKPVGSRVKLVPANNLQKETGLVTDEVEYTDKVSAGATGVKRKLGSNQEVSMEERLGNLCLDMNDVQGATQTVAQNPHNLSHLLIQGLDSKDRSILDSVLMKRDAKIIHETVTRLPVHALSPLVKEIKRMMEGRTLSTIIATEWMKVILREHASQLLADPIIQESLGSMQSLIEARLSLIGPLGALAGRLDHIMQQLDADSQGWRNQADSLEPVILYQEKDSSDDDGSIADGDYESEDKWDELSDQQLDSEPSS